MLKTYRTYRNLSYSVGIGLPGGKRRYVEFTGGTRYPQLKMPYFKTEDEAVQKALEAHPSFNKNYFLEEKREKKVDPSSSSNTGTGNQLEDKKFSNINEAKDFLKSEPHSIAANRMPNEAAVKNRGEELGFNIIIENNRN